MPHQCTNCARVFDDGSKEMLSGCPNCGGNKFQFRPDGVDDGGDANAPAAEPPEPPEPAEPAGSSVARTVGKTAATVRDLVGGSDETEPTVGAEAPDPLGASTDGAVAEREDTAQASARTDVVTADELPSDVSSETEHRFKPVRTDEGSDADGAAAILGDAPAADAPSTDDDHPFDDASATNGTAGQTPDAGDRPDLEELRA